MRDEYLWDGSGEPDTDVERLEKTLRPLRYDRPAPNFAMRVEPIRKRWFERRVVRFVAAAAMVLLVAGWLALRMERPSWDVVRLEGSPQVGKLALKEKGKLSVGEWLSTDGSSRAKIDVGLIGEVHVEPNTRLQLVEARAASHRLALEHGKMHARIWAPPRLFFVQTPSALATDLGCAYTLEVAADGSGLLRVEHGWVAFELEGRESFVPEGAMCVTRPRLGPGTPVYEDASEGLKQALETLDFGPANAAALDTLLAAARQRDTLTLWHLLSRINGEERARVYDRMVQLVPPPTGVSRDGIVAGDRRMRERYWNALGLGSTTWWRFWMGPPPAPR